MRKRTKKVERNRPAFLIIVQLTSNDVFVFGFFLINSTGEMRCRGHTLCFLGEKAVCLFSRVTYKWRSCHMKRKSLHPHCEVHSEVRRHI